jgi:hypothetical protein
LGMWNIRLWRAEYKMSMRDGLDHLPAEPFYKLDHSL